MCLTTQAYLGKRMLREVLCCDACVWLLNMASFRMCWTSHAYLCKRMLREMLCSDARVWPYKESVGVWMV